MTIGTYVALGFMAFCAFAIVFFLFCAVSIAQDCDNQNTWGPE